MSACDSDSQATFSKSVKAEIRGIYHHRCAVCLIQLPEVSIQSAHVIDPSTDDARLGQFDLSVKMGVLAPNYQRSAATNGMALCPNCHIGYFTPDLISLCPSLPVLNYINQYLVNTPPADQKPLHEVFNLLRLALAGYDVDLPDPRSILPYLTLFTVVILKPEQLGGCCISTLHLPSLSIFEGDRFVFAPNGTSPADENVARIFDVIAIAAGPPPKSFGKIPLSPTDAEFDQQRYWRLPVSTEAILAMLFPRIFTAPDEYEEVRVAKIIFSRLELQRLQSQVGGPSGHGGSGVSDGHGSGGIGGRPGRGRGGRGSGRGKASNKRNLGSGDRGKPQKRGREGALASRGEVASASCVSTVRSLEKSDSMSGKSHSDGCDDPAMWRFGPSYSSGMIVVAARGVGLV